ncbi:MAG: aminopeptidase [Caldilineaceae bacterium]
MPVTPTCFSPAASIYSLGSPSSFPPSWGMRALVRRGRGRLSHGRPTCTCNGWTRSPRAQAQNVHDDYLDSYPAFEIAARRQMVDETWARLAIVGPDDPDVRSAMWTRPGCGASCRPGGATRFYGDAQMANRFQWCVAAAPTPAWAAKVFPDLAPAAAEAALWELILQTCRRPGRSRGRVAGP